MHLWHCRLGHICYESLRQAITNESLTGIKVRGAPPVSCDSCNFGKMKRMTAPKEATTKAKGVHDRIHSDVFCFQVRTQGGHKYGLSFVDEFSGRGWIYFLKCKSEVFSKWKQFQIFVERQTGRPIRIIRTDNGGEFTSQEFESHLNKQGIRHETSLARRQFQNGIAERFGWRKQL